MIRDPIVEEVQQARQKIFRASGGTISSYFKHLDALQRSSLTPLLRHTVQEPAKSGSGKRSDRSRKDPIVEEVRRVRRDILRDFDGDFDKYVEHLMKIQKRLGKRLVNRKRPNASKSHGNAGRTKSSHRV
jgi:hypothetical protein